MSNDGETLPGQEVMGAGYNPFLGYASPLYVVSSIFAWESAQKNTFTYLNNKKYTKPVAIDAYSSATADIEEVFGQDIQSFQERLATSVKVEGSYLFFSGSLATEFSSQSLTSSDRSFSRNQQNITTWMLQITVSDSTRDLLRPAFRDALDNLKANDSAQLDSFLQTYGSHFLTGGVFGGRALRSAATNKYKVDRSYDLSVTSQQAFKFASGQASAEEKVQYSRAVSSFESNSQCTRSVVGGNPMLAANVFSSSTSFPDWRKSVVDYPTLVDFSTQNALTPIWMLTKTDSAGMAVRNALSNYFTKTWAPAQSDALKMQADYIDALTVVTGDSNRIPAPEGYTKINQDLNSDVEGKWIFLCYHKTSYSRYGTNKKAITDLKIIFGSSTPAPSGYTKISQDLNAGAGGDFVYLCYKTGDYDQNTAILDLRVICGATSTVPVPYGFTRISGDLNSGAGGDWEYVCYSKRGDA